MKLLIDMNLSPRWVEFFAASHIEANTAFVFVPN
jgi:predicted nuclease of predicted toxin-antitoxin system